VVGRSSKPRICNNIIRAGILQSVASDDIVGTPKTIITHLGNELALRHAFQRAQEQREAAGRSTPISSGYRSRLSAIAVKPVMIEEMKIRLVKLSAMTTMISSRAHLLLLRRVLNQLVKNAANAQLPPAGRILAAGSGSIALGAPVGDFCPWFFGRFFPAFGKVLPPGLFSRC